MSQMMQRESLKALESILGNATKLVPLIGANEIYMTNHEGEGEMWHIHVSNHVFENLTGKSMQTVDQSDNEVDGPLVQRISLQTANHIKLFTVYELKGETE